jgi:hypothetical protein
MRKLIVDYTETCPQDRELWIELGRIFRRLAKANTERFQFPPHLLRGSQRSGGSLGRAYCGGWGKFRGHIYIRVRPWLSRRYLSEVCGWTPEEIKAAVMPGEKGKWSAHSMSRGRAIGILCHELAHFVKAEHGYEHSAATQDMLTDCVTWGYLSREEADRHHC